MATETKTNFNITEWVDEYFSFIEDPTKQGKELPASEAELGIFFLADNLGDIREEPLANDFGYLIAKKRAEGIGLKCSRGALVLIATLSASPG